MDWIMSWIGLWDGSDYEIGWIMGWIGLGHGLDYEMDRINFELDWKKQKRKRIEIKMIGDYSGVCGADGNNGITIC